MNFLPNIHIQHLNFSLIANFQDLSFSNSNNLTRLTNFRMYKGFYVSRNFQEFPKMRPFVEKVY